MYLKFHSNFPGANESIQAGHMFGHQSKEAYRISKVLTTIMAFVWGAVSALLWQLRKLKNAGNGNSQIICTCFLMFRNIARN